VKTLNNILDLFCLAMVDADFDFVTRELDMFKSLS